MNSIKKTTIQKMQQRRMGQKGQMGLRTKKIKNLNLKSHTRMIMITTKTRNSILILKAPIKRRLTILNTTTSKTMTIIKKSNMTMGQTTKAKVLPMVLSVTKIFQTRMCSMLAKTCMINLKKLKERATSTCMTMR